MNNRPIRVVILNGSVRSNNYTAMAAAVVADELEKDPEVQAEIVNPGLDLPLPGTNSNAPGTKLLQEKVKNASAIILATPEYHGSFSSVTKLIIENLGFPSALSGKPVGLLGVAAGAIGAIKSLEHLRGVVSHVGGIVLPQSASVSNVHDVFDRQGHILDPGAEKQLRGLATQVIHYLELHECPRVALEALRGVA